ncbi:MAG TPA: GNAT family N-acetyltransferase [Gammaproteobacteria bacterium]|jgi:RimJ/RimL family protein N-acetyltransferase
MFSTIESKRVRLREFAERDLTEFARYRAHPDVARYQSWESFTLDDARRLYAKQQETVFGTMGSWHQIAIADKASDALMGDCALHFRSAEELEIGFTLAPEQQGKGLAREAVDLLLSQITRPRVLAVADAENVAAHKLLLALGFRKHAERDVIFKDKPGKEFDFVRT